MYFPFYKSGISPLADNDGVPVSPNFPQQTNDTDKCNNESSVKASSPKKQKIEGDHFELVQQKFLERNDMRKSPLPYIGMIAEAIHSSPDKKMVLSEIYTYMEQHYFQYLSGKPRWRNTVRHNLSFHKCFVKCECSRRGNRSHFWSIHPDYIEQFKRGNFTKTLSPPRDQVNVSPYAPEQQMFRRSSNESHNRFLSNSEYENYLHYDALSPPNANTLYQIIRPSTSAVLHPHCEVRPFPLVQSSSIRGQFPSHEGRNQRFFPTDTTLPSYQFRHLIPIPWQYQHVSLTTHTSHEAYPDSRISQTPPNTPNMKS